MSLYINSSKGFHSSMARGATTVLCTFLIIALLVNCNSNSSKDGLAEFYRDTLHVELERIATGLRNPVHMTFAESEPDRLYLLQQSGEIFMLKDGELVSEPFLDLSNQVEDRLPDFSEMGLLGLVFHPRYAENGRMFVYYTNRYNTDTSGYFARLSEFIVNGDKEKADISSEKILMEIECNGVFMNGGHISFGPDNMLYLGLGEGDGEKSSGDAQNPENLYGSILRIDVDNGQPYTIPEDNPFRDGPAPEVWAYGLRNPYRFTFNKQTSRLICGDVGDLLKEEINIIQAGGNYGWPVREGTRTLNAEADTGNIDFIEPFMEYDHKSGFGSAVVGSLIYDGNSIGRLKNKLVVADWSGELFYQDKSDDDHLSPIIVDNFSDFTKEERDVFTEGDFSMVLPLYYVNSLVSGPDNELYIVGQQSVGTDEASGSLFRVRQTSSK